MTAFYNELEPYVAAWMRTLIAAGHIAPGTVDERSIVDLAPGDLDGFSQCHFFAGVGVWSYALRLAGWDDARSVWTGSCPCQPFSVAGKQLGADDPRHLWPAWFRLIRECRPPVIFGEQVDGEAGRAWLDTVSSDLEGCGYAVGPAVFPAAGVGASHRRHRLYFVAYAGCGSAQPRRLEVAGAARGDQGAGDQRQRLRPDVGDGGVAGRLADDERAGRDRLAPTRLHERRPSAAGEPQGGAADGALRHDADGCCADGGLVHALESRLEGHARHEHDGDEPRRLGALEVGPAPAAGAHGSMADADGRLASDGELQRGGQHRLVAPDGGAGFWGDAEWIYCTDGFWRPVEPGSFPLAHGAPARMGRLRAYGNAIVAQQAAAFVSAAMEALGDVSR